MNTGITLPAAAICTGILLTGCGGGAGSRDDAAPGTVVTDSVGRTVAIPAEVNRVVSPFTMYTRLICALGAEDRLVGVSHSCVLAEERVAHGLDLFSLPDVGAFGANIELIASLDPDVIFASDTDVATFDEKTNAAVVATSFPHGTDIRDMFSSQVEIIGTVLHLEDRADSLIAFMDEKFRRVTDITDAIPESEKKKVYFAWTAWTGDIINTLYDFYPIQLAGGINVAAQSANFTPGERSSILVTRENIIDWNPDVILVSTPEEGAAPLGLDDILADPLLQDVTAIKTGRVYYTTSMCNWWPHQRAIVQTMYIAKLLYPERFADLDVEQEGNEIFNRFYGGEGLYSKVAEQLGLYRWQ